MVVARALLVLATALASVSAQGPDPEAGIYGASDDGVYGDDGGMAQTDGAIVRGTDGRDCDCPSDDVLYVCGSDGNTYDNLCMAQCAGVVPVFQGICNFGCICFAVLEPLCLVPDQTTFQNECVFGCKRPTGAQDNLLLPGACDGSCAHCTSEPATVCDVSPEGAGNEYQNSCYAQCSGVTQWQAGTCDEVAGDLDAATCGCTDASDPVCGVDGITYDSMCLLECADSPMAYTGACETDCSNCDERGGPEVCGKNGLTYMNACAARCAPTEVDATVEGPCPERSGCGCSAEVLEPVCAVSSNTYMNRCFAECARDEVESTGACEYDSDYFEPLDGYGNPIEVVDGVVVPVEQ